MSDEQVAVETAPTSLAEPQASFTAGNLAFNSAEAKYYFSHFIQPVTIHHTHQRGEVIAEFPIDLRLQHEFREWALNYLDYRFDGLAFEWTPVSPMGTTSGMAQAYFIPDPNVSCMHDTTEKARHHNLLQSARAEVSAMLRPRNATAFNISTSGTRFTQNDNILRFGSYGKVVIIVLSPPQVGDYCEWHVKLSGDLLLSRPTTSTYNRIYIKETKCSNLTFETINDEQLPRSLKATATFDSADAPQLNFTQAVVYFNRRLLIEFTHLKTSSGAVATNRAFHVSRGRLLQKYDLANSKFIYTLTFDELDIAPYHTFFKGVSLASDQDLSFTYEVPTYDNFQAVAGTYL